MTFSFIYIILLIVNVHEEYCQQCTRSLVPIITKLGANWKNKIGF